MRMNKKAAGNILPDTVVNLIILLLFFLPLFFFVLQQQEGAGIWSDYYAKEIVKVIDFSEPGDEAWIDVHKATGIAKKNEVKSFSEIFRIDNAKNEVCVKLSAGRITCYNYFSDVDVVDLDLILGETKNEEGEFVNVLYFKVIESQRGEDA